MIWHLKALHALQSSAEERRDENSWCPPQSLCTFCNFHGDLGRPYASIALPKTALIFAKIIAVQARVLRMNLAKCTLAGSFAGHAAFCSRHPS
jgi:hypothetical protein